jgi:iron complex transport system substrate-binding protein
VTRIKRFWRQILARGTNRFLVILSIALTIALVLTVYTLAKPASHEAEPASPQYVVDDLGRMVSINGTPQRIISLAPSNTEILFALGLGDKVVGVTDMCNYPPEALNKTKVGGYYGPDIEKIIALQPDLILATDFHRFELIPTLEEQGFTVFAVAPQTLGDVQLSIQKIGQITDKETETFELVNEITSNIKEIEEQTEELEEKPRVFYITWHDPMWTVGRDTWIDDLINIAGGVNIFSPYFESGAMVEIEWVVFLNPEIIITSSWPGVYEWAMNEPALNITDARRNGRVYTCDDDLIQRPAPRLVEGLEWFANFIHPEIFEEPED